MIIDLAALPPAAAQEANTTTLINYDPYVSNYFKKFKEFCYSSFID